MSTTLKNRNPAAQLFPEGFENWQILLLREALNQYKFRAGKAKRSDDSIANAITTQTHVGVRREAVRRFRENYYGYDDQGEASSPYKATLQAIASFLSSDRINCLKLASLQQPADIAYPPVELAGYISSAEDISGIENAPLTARYRSQTQDGRSVLLHLKRSKEMRYFIAREEVHFFENGRAGKSRASVRESVGWCVPSASGPIFFLKDILFGRFMLKVAIGDFGSGFPEGIYILRHGSPQSRPPVCLKDDVLLFSRLEVKE